MPVDPAWFERMLRAALRDGRPHAVKLGMLGDPTLAAIAADLLRTELAENVPIVVDPVLTGGEDPVSLARAGEKTYAALLSLADRTTLVLTPNAFEVSALAGHTAVPTTFAELETAARALANQTPLWVLAKGGHIAPVGTDVLVHNAQATRLAPVPHGPTGDVHGTGCRLSSALATHLAQGLPVLDAVHAARAYLSRSFRDQVARVGLGRPQFVAAPAADAVGDED